MINFDYTIKENIKEHYPNWPKTPDHTYRILIIGSSGFGKTNSSFTLIIHSGIDKIYLYANDPNDAKFELLINKQEK